jgi:hypothetical protein
VYVGWLQIILSAEVHLAKGQFLFEQTLNILWHKKQKLEDQQFPKDVDRTWNQGKPEKETVHGGDTSCYVRCAILTALKRKNNCNGHGEIYY